MAESNFNPFAVSPAGAAGIAQFMPATAAMYGLTDRFDAEASIDAQAHLMYDLLEQFGSPALALAAYNAGPGAVAGCGCVPAIPETQAYVARILGLMGGPVRRWWRLRRWRCDWSTRSADHAASRISGSIADGLSAGRNQRSTACGWQVAGAAGHRNLAVDTTTQLSHRLADQLARLCLAGAEVAKRGDGLLPVDLGFAVWVSFADHVRRVGDDSLGVGGIGHVDQRTGADGR